MTSSESVEQERVPPDRPESPLSRSSTSSPCSSIVSYSDREPFATYQNRIVALCNTVFGASATVEHLKGGDYNRVMGVSLPCADDGVSPPCSNYVVRIPRPWVVPMKYLVGPIKLMERFPDVPTPTVFTWDGEKENELGDPYLILERLPGQRLDELYGNLTHKARCVIAQDLGRIFATLGSIRNGKAGRPIWQEGVQLETRLSKEIVPLTLDVKPTESTAAMIESALRVRWDRRMRGEDWFCEILSATNKQMEQAGVWEDMACSYTLSHGDLEPCNILVSEAGITSILDWDSAEFAPQSFSCVAPWWLWDWENYQWHEEPVQLEHQQAGATPPTLEGQELKRLFDQAAGPVYRKYAYERKYQLGRALVRWMSSSVCSVEHSECFDRFEEEWASCWAELSTGEVP